MVYISLGIAIISELIATSLLRINATTSGFNPMLLLGIIVFYCVSFYSLGQSLTVIPTGIAYAIWSAVGIVILTVLDLVVYHTHFVWQVYLALMLIVCGVVLLNLYAPSHG
ncbi:SMR family transporter [Periweissella fabalis]|uniref:QacE family quaternary ammonium compound efflux SMR transporter n=1 Tax=Periweissella fabalis TaxID=1070421 RepID=A0A7X6S369_9LACO|nr:SMR family transporter [Periweissella fabalis]MCM0599378.1 QacE family quaternary ammonium compound efflux SMR transporter [Periweissella fabalis]NKZ23657.1 QacE family quaternary ammonium compound efflux SMR transporter [Periweissella fabalis]